MSKVKNLIKEMWQDNIRDFVNHIACNVLMYLTMMFVCTGIYMFEPNVLTPILGELGDIPGLTLQNFWQVMFPAIFIFNVAIKMICKRFTEGLMLCLSAIMIIMTGFEGNIMFLVYLLCIVIQFVTSRTVMVTVLPSKNLKATMVNSAKKEKQNGTT